MIDLHCHVLCGIDDGPETMSASVDLARAAQAAGIDTLVATPHVSPRMPNTSREIGDGVGALAAELAAQGVRVTVRPGGEVDVVRAVELDEDELRSLRLGGGEWLLVECPLSRPAADRFEPVVRNLHARGHRIVLAHPERSPVIRRRPQLLAELVEEGMLSSITAGSLTGRFGADVRGFALELIENGLAHNVTSDAHSAAHRPPGLRDEILAASELLPGLEGQLDWLTVEVPRAVLDGASIPPRPGLSLQRAKERGWSLRRRERCGGPARLG